MNEVFGFDAYAPTEIAEKIETIGVTKARLPVQMGVIVETVDKFFDILVNKGVESNFMRPIFQLRFGRQLSI